MHLYAARLAIEARDMLELSQVKIRVVFPIDARKKIEIECCRNSKLIVVSSDHLRVRFLQIRSQQHRVSRLKDASHLIQKFQSGHTVKITDGASEKQHKQVVPLTPLRRNLQQSVQVLALATKNAGGIDIAQFAFAHSQRGTRDFDRIVRRVLAAA